MRTLFCRVMCPLHPRFTADPTVPDDVEWFGVVCEGGPEVLGVKND